jgi:preprotein translocase subunit SecG
MFTTLLIVHGVLCVLLVILVLLQQGKGADMGATIGGGGSSSVFGGAGAVDFVAKLTTGLAITFMVTSILLVRAYSHRSHTVMGGVKSEDYLKGSLFDESDETKPIAPEKEIRSKPEVENEKVKVK